MVIIQNIIILTDISRTTSNNNKNNNKNDNKKTNIIITIRRI